MNLHDSDDNKSKSCDLLQSLFSTKRLDKYLVDTDLSFDAEGERPWKTDCLKAWSRLSKDQGQMIAQAEISMPLIFLGKFLQAADMLIILDGDQFTVDLNGFTTSHSSESEPQQRRTLDKGILLLLSLPHKAVVSKVAMDQIHNNVYAYKWLLSD